MVRAPFLSALVTALTSRVRPGCIDSVLVPQRAVQPCTVSTPLPQGEGQQLLQPHGLVAIEIHLRCRPIEDYTEYHCWHYVSPRLSFVERRLIRYPSTYWMAGLADDAAHFFKFLFVIVLYTLVMTLWASLPYLHPVTVADGPSPFARRTSCWRSYLKMAELQPLSARFPPCTK